jgi:phage-related protein
LAGSDGARSQRLEANAEHRRRRQGNPHPRTFRRVSGLYIATLPDAVYVLHAFQKKTQKTDTHDIELASARLKAVLKER